MIAAELRNTVAQHADESAEEIADDLYVAVKGAIESGQRREDMYAMLKALYADLKASGLKKERRAVGEVIRCFDGYCSPAAAL
jgi:hypothetical protein